MQSIIQLFTRYGTFLLFLLLEAACFILIVKYNGEQKEIFISSSNRISAGILQRYDKFTSYLNLDDRMRKMQEENARLVAELESLKSFYANQESFPDSIGQFQTIPAKVFNKSTFGNNNWFTLDRGSNHGVREGMGVINDKGVVGIVRKTSENFSLVMSVLHRDMRISGAIKNKSSHGLLRWKDSDPRILDLEFIPRHVALELGDTIQTSGFSNIFPQDIMIGTVLYREVPQGQNFYQVKVELAYDFFDVDYVYIIDNLTGAEVVRLEESISQ